MTAPNLLSDLVPVNNTQTIGTVWSPFKEGYFNKIIMSSGAGTNYDYDGSSNYTSMDLAEEEIKGAPAPSPWTSPENFFISGGSPGYWNRTDAGNRPGGHLGIRSGRNSYIEKSDGTFAETTSKPGIGFYVSKFGTDHPAASGTAEIKYYGYDEIAVMDNDSIRVDRPLVPYINEKTNIGDPSHNFKEAYIKNVKGNADTATKVNSSLSVEDAIGNSAITSWDGDTDETLVVEGTSPITATATTGKITVTHDNSGVPAGTYRSVTVDTKGHVTGGTNPTTLGDYKISDAKIENGTITLGSNTITPLTAESTLAADKVSGTLATNNIPNLDASKITTGTLSVDRMPSHTHGSITDGTMTLYAHNSNEVNFGGTNNSSTIYFGYRAMDSKPIPSTFIFGGTESGSATVKAGYVWGAVFNDLADAIPVGEGDVLEAGYCYGFDGEHYTKTSEYMQKSYIGIHSDTFGFLMGHEEGKEKLNVAVSGFVLAYVDKEYEVGTPLTCTEDGCLTEIKLEDKIKYPERIVATYWKNEPNEEWGPEGKKVRVNGRKWVKVK